MSGVIYADVLVVINFYVTYFILLSASLLAREKPNRLRLALSSFIGGFYSLSIIIPPGYKSINIMLRIGAAVLPVIITFGIRSMKSFFRLSVCYLVSSFLFAGLMFALRYFVCPSGMYFNGSVVYFDIDLLTLVVLTILCYGFLRLFDALFKSRAPVNTVFNCRVFWNDGEYMLKTFLDTGNNLYDPFTGKAVIIAERRAFGKALPERPDESVCEKYKLRFILCTTVSGKSLLPAFNPERVHIKGADVELITDKVMVALTEERLLGGDYDAILPKGLFEISEGKDEGESEKTSFVGEKNKGEAAGETLSFRGFLRQRVGESAAAADKGKGE